MSAKARFIEPMLLLRTEKLPEGPDWLYELKFDGYRALAIKAAGTVKLRSRNDKDFNARYPAILKALAPMPDDTVIDGEVVALDPEGRPSFNLLQNYCSAAAPLHFFIFDVLILKGEDVMAQPLLKRRQLLEKHVLPKLDEPIRYSPILSGRLNDLVHSVKAQRLEGLIAKRCDSKYEPGLRSGVGSILAQAERAKWKSTRWSIHMPSGGAKEFRRCLNIPGREIHSPAANNAGRTREEVTNG